MSDDGWIPVARDIFDATHPLAGSEPVCPRFAYLDLQARAAWAAHDVSVAVGQVVHLEVGQLIVSVRRLARAWRWSSSRVDRFLSLLAERGELSAVRSGQYGTVYVWLATAQNGVSQRDTVGTPERDTSRDTSQDTHSPRGCPTNPEAAKHPTGHPARHQNGVPARHNRRTEEVPTTTSSTSSGQEPRPVVHARREEWTWSALMGLVRSELYVSGQPPAGWSAARDGSILRAMIDHGYSPESIAAAIRGQALLRDRGRLEHVRPGEPLTLRSIWEPAGPRHDWARAAYAVAVQAWGDHLAAAERSHQVRGEGLVVAADIVASVAGVQPRQLGRQRRTSPRAAP